MMKLELSPAEVNALMTALIVFDSAEIPADGGREWADARALSRRVFDALLSEVEAQRHLQ